MTSNTLRCHLCRVVLADNGSTIKQHISSIHLIYRPYECRTCMKKGNIFRAATEEDMDAHITDAHISHGAANSGYLVVKDQIKETELNAAIVEFRRVSTSQLSSADTTSVRDQNPALNIPAVIDENVRVRHDSKERLRRVFISLGGSATDTGHISTEMKQENFEKSGNALKVDIEVTETDHDDEQTEVKEEHGQKSGNAMKSVDNKYIEVIEIDDDDEQTEVKEEHGQISPDVALESARPELEQNNAPSLDQTLPEAMEDLTDCPALNDCQATLLPVFNQPSGTNEEPTENQEVAPNIDFRHLNSANLYPAANSSDIMENKCEINTTDHFHGSIEKVHDSNETRASMITDQASNNSTTISSVQNKVQFASNASSVITALATSAPIIIPPLKRAIAPNKKNVSLVPKPPIASQEPRKYEEFLRRLMCRKHIHSDFETGYELAVERKRSRLSRTEQNLSKTEESGSVVTSIASGQNKQHNGFGESTDESATDDEESEYGPEESADESESNNETLISKTRTHDIRKANHRESNVQANSRLRARLQLKKKRQILQYNVGPKRAFDGAKDHKCELCQYTTNHKGHFERHKRSRSHSLNVSK